MLPSKVVEARLGKYNLTEKNEFGSTNHHISEIIIHPDWKYDQDSYDADIAILKLFSLSGLTDDYSSFVRPICLPEQLKDVVTGTGTTVGWRKSANSNDVYESTPSAVEQPVVDDKTCYTTDDDLAKYSSPRMFCGGPMSEALCSGDSRGFFFLDERSIWTIRGISSGGAKDAAGKCKANAHTLHTNVAKFSDWIIDKTTDWTKVEFHCSEFDEG